ncbi:hypothetical protein HK101_006794, partial [Irineochytrium annulatum]
MTMLKIDVVEAAADAPSGRISEVGKDGDHDNLKAAKTGDAAAKTPRSSVARADQDVQSESSLMPREDVDDRAREVTTGRALKASGDGELEGLMPGRPRDGKSPRGSVSDRPGAKGDALDSGEGGSARPSVVKDKAGDFASPSTADIASEDVTLQRADPGGDTALAIVDREFVTSTKKGKRTGGASGEDSSDSAASGSDADRKKHKGSHTRATGVSADVAQGKSDRLHEAVPSGGKRLGGTDGEPAASISSGLDGESSPKNGRRGDKDVNQALKAVEKRDHGSTGDSSSSGTEAGNLRKPDRRFGPGVKDTHAKQGKDGVKHGAAADGRVPAPMAETEIPADPNAKSNPLVKVGDDDDGRIGTAVDGPKHGKGSRSLTTPP